ncbi:MAG: hypothetical protein GY781_00275 [Gammaproteobacteria bacterium]|nr:hypothetical protein [Gammaproteobacteria bacterium]
MKTSLIIMLSLIFSAVSLNVIAGEKNTITLSPSVLMILDAGIQADSLLAERMISLDIKDELSNVQLLTDNNLISYGPVQYAINKTTVLEFSTNSDVTGLVSDAE